MEEALYGPAGFYRTAAPVEHFRTSVHVSSAFARALQKLADLAGLRTVVDLGAGRGELLEALAALDPELKLVAVEIRERPPHLSDRIEWVAEVPYGTTGLVVANEWLDNVPLDLTEGAHLVEVDEKGRERTGPRATDKDRAWLDKWWPGEAAEVGWPRDEAWAEVIERTARGIAVAIDYGHRSDSRPQRPTLAAYRDGRMVAPIPDGSCDLTAWVAMDSVAAAGRAAGAHQEITTTQQTALKALGLSGTRPALALATSDPAGYLSALAQAGDVSVLLDPNGLGGFSWLIQAKGMDLPAEVVRLFGGSAS
jgi:SAM-dependent MidA family methyltransferase